LSEVRKGRMRFDQDGKRILSRRPLLFAGTHSSKRINFLAWRFRHPSYLEVGVQSGLTLEHVRAKYRIGVEPTPDFSVAHLPENTQIFVGNSDDFFSANKEKFDIIFVDGLHEANQAYRDLVNSLGALKRGGVVLLDDVWPLDEPSAQPSLESFELAREKDGITHHFWYGDVYKVLGVVKKLHPELKTTLIGGNRNHIQALIWVGEDVSVKNKAEEAQILIDGWSFHDFFREGEMLLDIELMPEKQALRHGLGFR